MILVANITCYKQRSLRMKVKIRNISMLDVDWVSYIWIRVVRKEGRKNRKKK